MLDSREIFNVTRLDEKNKTKNETSSLALDPGAFLEPSLPAHSSWEQHGLKK